MLLSTIRRVVSCGATLVATTLLCYAALTGSPLHAAPLALGTASGTPSTLPDARLAERLDEAIELIREQLLQVPACRAYFADFGVDLDAWLSPDRPPYVVPRKLGTVLWRRGEPICGSAQDRPPFELLFVDPACFRGRRICELASLLLHELGHLARRDTRDNEPPEFFLVCRLSHCVDPGKFG